MARQKITILFIFILLMTLACNVPGAIGAEVEMQPIHLTATGQKADIAYGGNGGTCYVDAALTLDIKSDGTAHLSTTGPNFMDHINCTATPDFQESWDIDGTADPDSHVVTFTSCNGGGYRADGKVSYAGEKLSGKVSCIYLKGDDAGKPEIILTVQ